MNVASSTEHGSEGSQLQSQAPEGEDRRPQRDERPQIDFQESRALKGSDPTSALDYLAGENREDEGHTDPNEGQDVIASLEELAAEQRYLDETGGILPGIEISAETQAAAAEAIQEVRDYEEFGDLSNIKLEDIQSTITQLVKEGSITEEEYNELQEILQGQQKNLSKIEPRDLVEKAIHTFENFNEFDREKVVAALTTLFAAGIVVAGASPAIAFIIGAVQAKRFFNFIQSPVYNNIETLNKYKAELKKNAGELMGESNAAIFKVIQNRDGIVDLDTLKEIIAQTDTRLKEMAENLERTTGLKPNRLPFQKTVKKARVRIQGDISSRTTEPQS